MATMQVARIASRSPVRGLRRRRLPFADVLAQAVAAVAPAGVMSTIPALVLRATGVNLLLAFSLALGVVLLVAACVRPMTQRMSSVSGLYAYIAKGLGPVPAVLGGWSAVFGYALIGMTGVFAVGVYTGRALRTVGWAAPGAVVAPLTMLAAAAVMAALMIRGVRVAARVVLVVECVAIGFLLALMWWYLAAEGVPAAAPAPASAADPRQLAVAVILSIGAFVGFESASTLGGEARRPLATVPRAIRWTPLATGALYLVAVAFQEYVLRPRRGPEDQGALVELLATSPSVAFAIDVCIATSFFACALASLTALARVLFCMGREGVLPGRLGAAHVKRRTPHVAILLAMPPVAAVPAALALAGVPGGQALTDLILLSGFGYLGSYLLACAAMPLLLHRIGEARRRSWALAAVAVTTLAVVVVGATALQLAWAPHLPALYGAVMLGAVAHVLWLRRRRPWALARVGVYDETVPGDLLDPRPAGA